MSTALPVLNFGSVVGAMANATQVISTAAKFAYPVPPLMGTDGSPFGDPLVYPEGSEVYGATPGDALRDWEGNALSGRGVVWTNPIKEQSAQKKQKPEAFQAVRGYGASVIIMNEITRAQVEKLLDAARELMPIQPSNLIPTDNVREFLSRAAEIGKAYDEDGNLVKFADMYDTGIGFDGANFSPVQAGLHVFRYADADFGWVKRNARDIFSAMLVTGAFGVQIKEGMEPQTFEDGAVVVHQGGEIRGIETPIFLRSHLLANGGAVPNVEDLYTIAATELLG